MYEKLISFLDTKNWKYRQVPDKKVIHFGINASNGNLDCVAEVKEDTNQFVFLSFCTVKASQDKYNPISELITRINYSLIIGDFELSFEDGRIRFKSSMFYDDLFPVTEKLIEKNIITNLYMMDHYLPGIMSVMFGKHSPQQAIQEIDGFPGFSLN